MSDQSRSGERPERNGLVEFVFPGGVKAVVGHNLLSILVLGGGGAYSFSWAAERLQSIEHAVAGVVELRQSIKELEGTMSAVTADIAKRAMIAELEQVRAELERHKADALRRDMQLQSVIACLQGVRRSCVELKDP